MKNKNLMYLGVAAAAYLLFFQRKSVAGINGGVNDSKTWNIDRIKNNLGRVMIEMNELRDLSYKNANKLDMAYTSGMSYVFNQIFTDAEKFQGLSTQFK